MSARHILVGDEATANDIITKIKKGENFDQLAKTYSEEKNPNLGYFTKQMMVPEFADAAFRMKKDSIRRNRSKPTSVIMSSLLTTFAIPNRFRIRKPNRN